MITYRKATIDDIPMLTQCRITLLRSAIGRIDEEKMRFVEKQVIMYYTATIPNETHVAYLALQDGRFAGTGGVCFYRVLPTYFKPTGQKAYIINMFTNLEYRRQGIGTKILDLLVKESLSRGATYISLEATDMGRSLYEKYGFGRLASEMQYINETYEGPDSR